MLRSCVIVRRVQFAASHRYWLPELSEAENFARFGPTARFPGHGHNYVADVSLEGQINELGMFVNLSDVKRVINSIVLKDLNFSYLNETWPEFKQTLPTTEFIAHQIWQRLAPELPLVSVKLYEDPYLWAEYRGDGMKACLTISAHFSAAHRLALDTLSPEENFKIFDKCARPNGHGHNYSFEVSVSGEIDPRTGMIIDLVGLQEAVDQIIVQPWDHTFLNKDIEYFARFVPTVEVMALRIQELLTQPIRDLGGTLHRIRLEETANNAAEVYGEYPGSAYAEIVDQIPATLPVFARAGSA